MWIERNERKKIQGNLTKRLSSKGHNNLMYRLLVEDLINILDRRLAFVLIALLEGYRGIEIARLLKVSPSTVTNYKKKIARIVLGAR